MPFYKPSSQRKLRKFFKRNGFKLEEGGEHCLAIHENGTVIAFPRHNNVSNGVTREICKSLIALGYQESEINKLFK